MGLRGVLVGALVLTLVVAVAIVAMTRSEDGGPLPGAAVAVAGTSRAAAEVSACADVLVLGVDGNGERRKPGKRFGPTVDRAVSLVVAALQARGRTVDKRAVGLRTKPASALVSKGASGSSRGRLSRARAASWLAPVKAGVGKGVKALNAAATQCGDQQLVLVGHAQGAGVVHRMQTVLAKRPGLSSRLVGSVLVADPYRRAPSAAVRVGAPKAPKKSAGLMSVLGRPVADVAKATPLRRTWSVCTRGDLVCAPSATPVRRALATTRSYQRGKGARAVAKAAGGIAVLAAKRPVPSPRSQVVSLTVGDTLSLQLGLAPTSQTGVSWRATSALPAGLSLSSTGLLAGTAVAGGLATTTYAVRGTSPATPDVRGVLTIRVGSTTDAVAAGGRSSCEIRLDATAWCWGGNQWGQVGDATTVERRTPTQVGAGTDWNSIDTSGATTCGTRTNGTLWCWGLNTDTQLGIGGTGQRETPQQVGTATDWTQFSTGWHSTCGVRASGTLWCWGLNDSGQLGTGNRTAQPRPVQVGTGTDWSQVQVGGFFACGLRAGTAWCWGGNGFGQLGSPAGNDALSPVPVAGATGLVTLSASWATVCATGSTGAAWCWGRGDRGQLGTGSSLDVSSPTRVAGTQTWTTIAVGDSVTCGVDATGRGWCWGDNRYGQLGNGSGGPSGLPVPVASGATFLDLGAGWMHGCAALSTGRTACWGNNELGQIGDGTVTNAAAPKEIT